MKIFINSILELISQLSKLKITLVQPIFLFRATFQFSTHLHWHALYRISHTYTFFYLCMSGDSSIHCKSIVLDSYYDKFCIQCVKTYFTAVKCNNNEVNKVTCLFYVSESFSIWFTTESI